jgi:23S rRNA-/tRNA-specific pseudouridylate synthase
MKRRFVVRTDDERSLEGILQRLGAERTAVDEGRVFIGPRRAERLDVVLSVGDEVSVASRVSVSEEVTLLGEYRGIFAFVKPPGLPTVPDRRGSTSLLQSAARALDSTPAELHVVTRLDTNVSGVVIVAHGEVATRQITALQRAGGLSRRYLGIALRCPSPETGTWNEPIPGASRRARSRGRNSKPSETLYRVWAKAHGASRETTLVVFEPLTGRTHQIRIHSSKAGTPLLGDVAYGGPARVVVEDGTVLEIGRVALHASRVSIFSDESLLFSVEAPHSPDLVSLWRRLGGAPSDFDAALASPAFTRVEPRAR